MTTAPQVETVSKKRSWRRHAAQERRRHRCTLRRSLAGGCSRSKRRQASAAARLQHKHGSFKSGPVSTANSRDPGENASFPGTTPHSSRYTTTERLQESNKLLLLLSFRFKKHSSVSKRHLNLEQYSSQSKVWNLAKRTERQLVSFCASLPVATGVTLLL